ncbi:adenylylsulfate kinase [Klebsiella variicola]|uniref:Adenylyl-sulfate kinase n=1 Tax=Klebsiella variicola TaxID=244366 RepID=A0A7H4MR95_KLEVA|nr:adenylylsulfate kinase [Klebsiella variicola]
MRHGLCSDLGFSDEDRKENIRRVGEVARLMVDAGLVVLTAFISPHRAERQMVRERLGEGRFIEVFVDTRWPSARRGIRKDYTRRRGQGNYAISPA